VQKGQHERLPQSRRRPDQLAEEVDRPERLGVNLEELVPRSLAPLRARLDPFFLADILDCGLGDAVDSQFLALSENPPVASCRLPGQPNNDLTHRLLRLRPTHFLG
jgi:hypothetical protein